jgi:hypothetical protein
MQTRSLRCAESRSQQEPRLSDLLPADGSFTRRSPAIPNPQEILEIDFRAGFTRVDGANCFAAEHIRGAAVRAHPRENRRPENF